MASARRSSNQVERQESAAVFLHLELSERALNEPATRPRDQVPTIYEHAGREPFQLSVHHRTAAARYPAFASSLGSPTRSALTSHRRAVVAAS